LANGTTRPISEIREGDMVLATDPETGETGGREVTGTLPHTDQLLTLRLSSGDVVTTEDHKYWNVTDQAWQESQDLDHGDRLLTADGDHVTVEGLDWTTLHTDAAYDLSVAEFHSYYVGAGDESVLVHNCKGWYNRHGQLTNGKYTIDEAGMAPHKTGSFGDGKSQWFSGVDAEQATLDAASYADTHNLWVGNKAKVPVSNGNVGALGSTGEPTQWINVYRTDTGFVHGSRGAQGDD
jgi:hypothetical protein